MAHPKRQHSKSRQGKRRSHHKIGEPTLAECDNCGAFHRYHHICQECGFYRGRQIIDVNK